MRRPLLLALTLAAAPLAPARAEEPAAEPPPAPAADASPATRAELDTLAAEVRRLKLEVGIPDVEYKSFGGLGPAASKVYFVPKGLSIGGYGELVYQHYSNARGPDGLLLRDMADIRRLVLYTGYRFTDKVVLNAEIEFEHGHEAEIEFAYLDFLFMNELRLRAGLILIPLGFINEIHEPAFFNGVDRPELENTIIPTTWREIGGGLHGEVAGLKYKAYLVTGLDAFKLGPRAGASWMKGGRGHGGQAPAESFAGVASLAYDLGPVSLGGGFYGGSSAQGASGVSGTVLLGEVHAQLAWRRLLLRAIYALGSLGDAGPISTRLGLSGSDVIASRVRGGYVEAAYDVLGALEPDTEQALSPFVRYESLDLHDEVPAGFVEDPALDRWVLTLGVTYKPIPTVAAKLDYQWKGSASEALETAQQLNVGLGFVF